MENENIWYLNTEYYVDLNDDESKMMWRLSV